MRIAILSICDNAGSGQRFAEALRGAGHEAMLMARDANPYGYNVDLLVRSSRDREEARLFIKDADVLHFKGDWLPSDYATHFPLVAGKPRAITVGGSGFRKLNGNVREHMLQCNALGAITPDLLVHPDMRWIPHAYPVPPRNPYFAPKPGDPIAIGHSPSNRAVKGTDTVFQPAVRALQERGRNVIGHLIEGLQNTAALALKKRCHLFFDQANLCAYGISAVEAMAEGIPVATREPQQRPQVAERLPVCFAEPTPDAAALCMDNMLDALHEYSRAFFAYARRVHSYPAVAERLLKLYDVAMERHHNAEVHGTPPMVT